MTGAALPTDAERAPLLSKSRTIAPANYDRWRVPPAALAIHLCIGMAYGFSVFWLPLSRAVGIEAPLACEPGQSFFQSLVQTHCDWKISQLGWMYTLFFVFLGSSAAAWGGWLEREGPRKAGVVAAACWCGGLLVSAFGIHLHQLWLLWLGSGVLGGIGLGLGYISPVSTLIKWFPDRRGMATGMAIMGFGGGAMIGAPLADRLIRTFATQGSVGVWESFVVLAAIYFVFMLGGAFSYRIPPVGWTPGSPTATTSATRMITTRHVHVDRAWRTPQFWLLWSVLCLNVSAGIGVIGMASPMLQEIFGGRLIGLPDLPLSALDTAQAAQVAAIAAGFTGLLSLFNIGGRLAWSSASDRFGRKTTYTVFFVLGLALYAAVPSTGHAGNIALFVLCCGVILSMYGGGFATVPAYLADLFGTQMVGAIHGRLLTAWSTAGIVGPVIVNYIREFQIDRGISPARAYDTTLYVLAGLLLIGLICNGLVRPVAERHFMSDEQLRRERERAHEAGVVQPVPSSGPDAAASSRRSNGILFLAWSAVGLPLAWGVWVTLEKAAILLR
ncbi:MAG: OFA family MFS transporter [Panacagrimonas sp.]